MDKPDDTEAVEIPASALCAKRLLERYCHICNVVTIPQRSKYSVSKSKHRAVQHQLMLKILSAQTRFISNRIRHCNLSCPSVRPIQLYHLN